MAELELVGLDQGGERLVLRGDDGLRFTLPIDEALRAAVRRDRPQLEQVRTEQSGILTPREIQARIRAGETAAEIAESADVTVQHVRRFEGPVLDERAYIAEQARTAPVGREADAPALGDLVADRLVARGVEISSLTWDAARDRSGPWVVVARFVAADEPRVARWAFDPSTKALTAAEDEARWLSETEITEPPARRHLTAVRPAVFDYTQVEATTGPTPVAAPADPTATLLDELGSRRGKRQQVDLDDGPDTAPSTPTPVTKTTRKPKTTASRPTPKAPTTSTPAAAPSPSSTRSTESPDHTSRSGSSRTKGSTRTKTSTSSTTTGATSTTGRGRRKGRAKVPSWDEIVFGAKPE